MGPRAGLDEQKISSPPVFDPRTVQPVASRYINYSSRPNYCAVKLKVKQSHYRPEVTTARDGCKVVSLTHRPPLPPGNTNGTYFF